MQSSLHALPVLQDNVIWIWVRGDEAVVVDPAVAGPVQQWLQRQEVTLVAILQTHHHADHIGGTPELLDHWPQADVVAAAADRKRIPFQTLSVAEGDAVDLMGRTLQVMDVAAHTSAHIAFHLSDDGSNGIGSVLFCGDTLFAGGCGRLFEGSAEQMHAALQRFAALPESTKVCCAHEYTEGNLRWAAELRPDDRTIADRHQEVRVLRSGGALTLPSSIGAERRTNLFMQAQTAQELAELRHHKDHWRTT